MKRIGPVCSIVATGMLLAMACFAAAADPAAPGAKPIVIPAIAFSDQGGGTVKKVNPSSPAQRLAGGSIHFWYTPGHWLEWTFQSPSAGDCQLSLYYATKYPVARGLELNGQPVKGLDCVRLNPTGRWKDWAEANVATVPVKAGRNVLRLSCLDDQSMFLGEVRLAAAGQPPIVIPAPTFSAQGGGQVQVLSPPSLGRVQDWTAKGQWLEWVIEDVPAGQYGLSLHYAADARCGLEVQVNGQAVQGLDSFALSSTGDWQNWSKLALPAPVGLQQGRNVVRLTSGGGAELGLSVIELTSPPPKAPADEAQRRFPQDTPILHPGPKPEANLVANLGPPLPAVPGAVALAQGTVIPLAGRKATLTSVDVLPYVRNEYSDRYVYEAYENPRRKEIRDRYRLDQVVAGGKDEFAKQLILMEWAWDRWDFGHARERYNLTDPFEILEQAKREHKFQCMHSAAVLMAATNSLGWVCRQMVIPQHTFNEVWSNEHRRWVMFDATSNYAPERADAPMNTFELRQGLLYEDGNGVVSLRHTGGRFTRTPKDPKYGQRLLFVGYVPNTNNLLSGPQYGQMFITKDKLCEGKKWHTRPCPADPAREPYFPINQAAMALAGEGPNLRVTLGTLTPNFKEFQVRLDEGPWKTCPESFTWNLRASRNKLQVKSVNKFGVDGPVSTVQAEVEE